MIIDLMLDEGPKQYQHVRKIDVQVAGDDEPDFKLVINFYDELYPELTIGLNRIDQFTITND